MSFANLSQPPSFASMMSSPNFSAAMARQLSAQRNARQVSSGGNLSRATSTADDVPRSSETSENETSIRMTVDLPGVYLRDLDVSVTRGVLFIRGCRRTFSVDGEQCVKKFQFLKRYSIDTDVIDIHRMTSNLCNGVLTIRAPKKAAPTKVQISVTENEEAYPVQEGTEQRPVVSFAEDTGAIPIARAVPQGSGNNDSASAMNDNNEADLPIAQPVTATTANDELDDNKTEV